MAPPAKKRKIFINNLTDLKPKIINEELNKKDLLWEKMNLSEPILKALSLLE